MKKPRYLGDICFIAVMIVLSIYSFVFSLYPNYISVIVSVIYIAIWIMYMCYNGKHRHTEKFNKMIVWGILGLIASICCILISASNVDEGSGLTFMMMAFPFLTPFTGITYVLECMNLSFLANNSSYIVIVIYILMIDMCIYFKKLPNVTEE